MDRLVKSSRLHIIVDSIRTSSPSARGGIFSGVQWDSIEKKIIRAGFDSSKIKVSLLKNAKIDSSDLILGMGERPLNELTGKKSVDKYHMTPLRAHSGQLYIPTFDISRINKQNEFGLFQELAFHKAFKFLASNPMGQVERFLLNPCLDQTFEVLRKLKDEEELAIDVETGWGQVNTVGFAWSAEDAIAINVLPDRLADKNHLQLWKAIADVLEGPSKKIFQNFIYDTSYFSAYGINTNNIHFDTMFAQKILYPEFKSNLGNVGRMFTDRPYWKDDGKTSDSESEVKDWGNIRDWQAHYIYNCRDTSGTWEASKAQREELKARDLEDFYFNYVKKLKDPIREMCARGMPLDLSVRDALKTEISGDLEILVKEIQELVGWEMNPKSWQQKLKYFHDKKYTVPKKFDKTKERYKESTDSTSIKKLRLKYEGDPVLDKLLIFSTKAKALSSYIDFVPRPDGKLSYSINGCGTETLRFSGGTDAWGRGINIQTMPREGSEVSIKKMFVAPKGRKLFEVDLAAAESRYVAYESADAKLIQMLEDGEDVHKHVALNIMKALGEDLSTYSKKWRNLAKPVGHGGNYLMKEGTLAENIFKTMEISISKKDAKAMLEAYHAEFPKIREWQHRVRKELWSKRRLKAPSGWERYFYGRPDDNMHREGIAWVPQHTIPWVTNHLMLYLLEQRREGNLDFHLLAQVHDSLILLVPDARLEDVTRKCKDIKKWHPQIDLLGGRMWIPVDCEAGQSLSNKEEIIL